MAVLMVDGLLSIGFGTASWISPEKTFGTLVDLQGAGEGSLFFAMFSSLSIFYILTGLFCLSALFMQPRDTIKVALVMAFSHILIGLKGFNEVGEAWLIGNPWPDIVIHTVFLFGYGFGIAMQGMRLVLSSTNRGKN